MASTREVLVEARRLIEDPEKWSRGHPGASEECIVTALVHAGNPLLVLSEPYRLLLELIGPTSLAAWNDSHSHAEVLDLFDRAIGAAS
jgi:hypothetical protein